MAVKKHITEKEYLAIVDKNDKLIGKEEKNITLKKKLLHRVIRIYIANHKNQFLLLKRPKSKKIYPDCWEIGVGAGVKYNETYLTAAKRELKEEIGVSQKKLKLLKKVRIIIPAEKVWAKIYSIRLSSKIKPARSEIVDTIFLPRNKVMAFQNNHKAHELSFVYFEKLTGEGLL